VCGQLAGNPNGRDGLVDLDVSGRIILKFILIDGIRIWIRFIALRIRYNGRVLSSWHELQDSIDVGKILDHFNV
jgi:hypothetical protein